MHTDGRRCGIFLALALLAQCGGRPTEIVEKQAANEVRVVEDGGRGERVYSMSQGDCRVSLTVFTGQVNEGVMRYRGDCGLDLAGQAALLKKILRKVMASDALAGRFRSLMWGRMYPDQVREATLAVRVAVAAKRAADWDVRTGRPASGSRESWVARVLEEGKLYEEVREVFAGEGITLKVSSTEKALVGEAERLPFYEQLRAAGVEAKDKVPFDVQLWFRMER